MRRYNIAAALALIGLAGYILFEAGKLNLGSIRVPQTGFFPKTLAVLLLALSLGLLVQALRQTQAVSGGEKIAPKGWLTICATLATLAGFALVLERLGFFLSTFLLMVFLLRAIEAPKWSKVLLVALATSLISYAIFSWLLGVPLPAGLLGI